MCDGVDEIASRDIHEIARVLAQEGLKSTTEKALSRSLSWMYL